MEKKKKKIEFHVHTISSKDSMLTKYLILLICKLKKIDCLAITDHNEVHFSLKNKNFFKKHNIDIIVGEEIFTSDGEIIGLYLNKRIEPNLSAIETVKEIRKQGGLVYIPHPYDEKRKKTVIIDSALKKIRKEVDFIEKHNGRNVNIDFSNKQNKIAEKYNLRKIVGSDAHTFYELGRNYCLVESYDRDKLIENIENAIFKEKKCIKFSHLNTKLVKTIKMISRGDFHGIIRIIKKKFTRGK